ncbi:MAG: LysR substrate-binding domain-containing protein [Clostridia bacterium]
MNSLSFKYFSEIAKELNFTRAAERLYVTQQCLSQHIKQLEDHFDVMLFERKPTLKLTYAGQQLLEATKQFQAIEEHLLAEFSYIRQNYSGKIALGIPRTRSYAYIPIILPLFKNKYPNVEFSLKEAHTASLENYILNGEIDVMIGVDTGETPVDEKLFHTIKLLDETVYLLVSDDLLKQHFPDQFPACKETFKNGVCLQNFADFPLIMNPHSSRIHTGVQQYFRDRKIKPNILIESNNGPLLLPLCKQGMGVIFSPQMVLYSLIKQDPDLKNKLNILPINDCLLENKVVLRYYKDKVITKYLLDLIEMTQVLFKQYQNLSI